MWRVDRQRLKKTAAIEEVELRPFHELDVA
jgi:hypothetical protein